MSCACREYTKKEDKLLKNCWGQNTFLAFIPSFFIFCINNYLNSKMPDINIIRYASCHVMIVMMECQKIVSYDQYQGTFSNCWLKFGRRI